MPPAMPNPPDTSEATNTAIPIAASATSDMYPYPCHTNQAARPIYTPLIVKMMARVH
jgi:hypothetical protein